MKSPILVTGASGKVGGAVVGELRRRGETVRAAVRDPRKLLPADGVEVVRFDFSEEATFGPALERVNRIFLLPPPGHPQSVEVAWRLLELAAPRLSHVVTLTTAGTELEPDSPLRQLELRIERSGIPWTHLRPNWFAQNFNSLWLPGVRTGTLMLPAGDGRCAFIDARDLAEVAAIALTSEGHAGKAYYLSGPEALSFYEATNILSRQTDADVHYHPLAEGEFRDALLQSGVPEQVVSPLLQLFAAIRDGSAALIGPDTATVLGRAPRTFAEYARDYREMFAPQTVAAG